MSLALHAAVLLLPAPTPKYVPGHVSSPIGRLHLQLMQGTAVHDEGRAHLSARARVEPASASSSKQSIPGSKREGRRETALPPASNPRAEPDEEGRGNEAAPSPEVGGGLDIEGMRRQARRMTPEQQRAPGGTAARTDALDRPALEALARRLGQPVEGVREEFLADGSRRIRFSGGACLNIPRYLALGRENAIGPTMLIPETCPRSGR